MIKRILLLGLAVAALAIALPAIVAQSGFGEGVAQAQTPPDTTDPDDQADPPEAPDQADPPEAPDQADPPEAPDQADPPDAPETPDQGDTPGEDDEGSGDDEDDEDEEQTPAPPANNTAPKSEESAPSGGNNSGGSESGRSGNKAPQTPLVRVSSQPVSGVDTGTIPQGGIQAGAGGTAGEGSPSALLLGSAALMLVLMAGGLVLRRRGFES